MHGDVNQVKPDKLNMQVKRRVSAGKPHDEERLTKIFEINSFRLLVLFYKEAYL